MFEISNFTINPLDSKLPKSELIFDGKLTGIIVDGIRLEKQLSVAAGYLIILTENSPYEEGLHIYLINRSMKLLDSLELSLPYGSGILKDFRCDGANLFSFSFFGEDHWRLDIYKVPVIRLNIALLSPVKRKSGILSSRWLDLARIS